ncbi:MAG: signal peptidase I [candidate division Zixibacteria bacterium]|nr:signal peptidase I [Candidatus Tariuqbacter arcticus]
MNRSLIYTGSSMHPTLKNLDKLQCEACRAAEICPGDIIVFTQPGNEQKIVHRVIAKRPGRLVTCGDNRYVPDKEIVTDNEIIGKVVFARRETKRIPIINGLLGLAVVYIIRARKKLANALINQLLRPVYYLLCDFKAIKRLIHRKISYRILAVKSGKGMELQLHIKNKKIGRLRCGSTEWKIKPPFKLLLDESSLPNFNDFSMKL